MSMFLPGRHDAERETEAADVEEAPTDEGRLCSRPAEEGRGNISASGGNPENHTDHAGRETAVEIF